MRAQEKGRSVTLQVPFEPSFLPLALGFAEQSGRGLGCQERQVHGLLLAVEELFSFYQPQARRSSVLLLEVVDQGYRVVLTLDFEAADPDLRPLNLTWAVDGGQEDSLQTLGPMLAARAVTSLRMEFPDPGRIRLTLTRDRDYPPSPQPQMLPSDQTGPLRLGDLCGEDLFALLVREERSASQGLPVLLGSPGRAVDLWRAGHLGVVWLPWSAGGLERRGPFCPDSASETELPGRLLDEAVSRVSRSRYWGLVRRQGPLDGYERFFDHLGETGRGSGREVYYYRHLREEGGAVVYARGHLAAFLREACERLCLPREVREGVERQEELPGGAVLTTELDWTRSRARLLPLRPGCDMVALVREHRVLLERQGIVQLLMELNVGRAREALFAAALEADGWTPRLLIPDAQDGDRVLYEGPQGAQP